MRRSYRDVLRLHGAERFVHLLGDAGTIQARMMARRGHFMDADMLDSQFATLESTHGEIDVAPFEVNTSPRDIVAEVMIWLQTGR